MLVKDVSMCILFHGGAWSNDYFSGSRRAIYSLFPEIPIRYATTHVSGLSGLLAMGFADAVGPFLSPAQNEFQLSNAVASLIPFVGFVMFGLLSIPMGVYQDKHGKKLVLMLGLVVAL